MAIKRVPKEKVKRWGKLEGRVVPIEFELLYRAAKSGNKGIDLVVRAVIIANNQSCKLIHNQ